RSPLGVLDPCLFPRPSNKKRIPWDLMRSALSASTPVVHHPRPMMTRGHPRKTTRHHSPNTYSAVSPNGSAETITAPWHGWHVLLKNVQTPDRYFPVADQLSRWGSTTSLTIGPMNNLAMVVSRGTPGGRTTTRS